MSAYPGFPREGIAFLRDLKRNNNRDWFQARKDVFDEKVRRPMIDLVAAVHQKMLRFAPEYVGDPAKCVYRIYRDTRFSPDKTPYKTYVSALLLRRGFDKHEGSAGWYFALSPKQIDVAGGIYTPDRETLMAVRQHIAANAAEFRKLIAAPRTRRLFGDLHGQTLTRPPKGFDPEHPAIDLLKRKEYILWAKLAPGIAVTPQIVDEIAKHLETMTPFLNFLNRPLLEKQSKRKRDQMFLK